MATNPSLAFAAALYAAALGPAVGARSLAPPAQPLAAEGASGASFAAPVWVRDLR